MHHGLVNGAPATNMRFSNSLQAEIAPTPGESKDLTFSIPKESSNVGMRGPVSLPQMSVYTATKNARWACFNSSLGGASAGKPRTSLGILYINSVKPAIFQCPSNFSTSI